MRAHLATLRHAAITTLAALVTACAVGPNYKRPPLPPATGYAPAGFPRATAATPGIAGGAQSIAVGRDVSAEWWELFQSPPLNALIARAFTANPTIGAAVAALRQAQENVYAQRGFFFPTLEAGYQAERTKLSGNTATANTPIFGANGVVIEPTAPAQPVTYNFHTAQLTVGYSPDIFGLNRRQVESLQAQADQARFELQAAYVTLASNVVAAALQEAATRAQIAAVRAIIEDNRRSVEILRGQLRLGYVMRLDVAAQEAALAQAQAQLPPLEKQLAQTRDLLRVLVGNAPDHDVPETFELSALHLPGELPLSLPSKLIEQRPDVRAAEEQVHAASAEVGVAVANRLPQFSLTGDLGGNAPSFSQMFLGSGTFWDILGGVSETIFDGGTLRHRQRAAEQGLIEAAAQYRSTVLGAFQNVADTLHALYADADALKTAAAAERAARITLDLTRRQLQVGYVNYLSLLAAEQSDQQAQIALVQAQATRLGDTAALFQALGGGWWNRPSDEGVHPDQPHVQPEGK
ncbi:MAG TPA: efflux transporter outer membrane subunit [Steroidobacteraceae bacterium]|nr:efflux transporter outer membrane subunit [Steroidobacteraceae bacterium]